MKPLPFAFLVALVGVAAVRSQDAPVAPTQESATTPDAASSAMPGTTRPILPTTARILGNIPDGTPPPPAPPKPTFIIPAKDILTSASHQQGGRTITIQKIKPIALPPLPEPETAMVASDADVAAFKVRMAAYRAQHPRARMLGIGASVYRFDNAPPRTLVSYWPGDGADAIQFWSSADFALISGIHSFVATDGQTNDLLMMWSSMNVSRMAAMFAAHGRPYHAPVIPTFPTGPATFTCVGAPPTPEILVAIQSLHDIYNTDHERLQTAWEGRKRASIERDAYLKAHPPQPQDIVINYWRTDKPAPMKRAAK